MKSHWPEYIAEAAGLGLFMLAAAGFGVAIFHPGSPFAMAVPDGIPKRAVMGGAMALTAVLLIHNRWGKQSGAHFNPALTFTFWRLGKVAPGDAAAYITAQFLGGTLGMLLAEVFLAPWLAHPSVNHVATLPGPRGSAVAWIAEFAITFALMTVVLSASASPRLARFTGVLAAGCVFFFITFEAPLSGMSLNPARSFASAMAARDISSLWVYFTAPPLGMLSAGAVLARIRTRRGVACAKLHHDNPSRCIFCEYQAARTASRPVRFSAATPLTRI